MSALSKPFEKHINKHILAHFNKIKLFHPNQSGYRENHSCHTILTSAVVQWFSSINDNKYCGALFVDFAKAFAVTDYDLLLRKLAVYELSPETLTVLVSFLTDRKRTVHASASDARSLKYGVPQGSVLGPLLFSICINNFPLFIKACCELFADDTAIHSSKSNLRKLTESLQESVNSLLKMAEFNHVSPS